MRICHLGGEARGDVKVCNGQIDVKVWYVDGCRELDGSMLIVDPLHQVEQLLFPLKPERDDVVSKSLPKTSIRVPWILG